MNILFPAITCQAYLRKPGGACLAIALVKTVDLIKYAQDRIAAAALHSPPGIDWNCAPTGEQFLICHWSKMRDAGIQVRILR